MEDADLDAALDAAVTAGFANAGQWCTSTSRILLQRSIAGSFLEKLIARCEKMTVGDGLLETTDMGPVAGPQQYQDIRSAICKAQTDGARMIAGGDAGVPPDGYFIRPTVFTGVRCDMEIFREEIFGPVLAVSEFDSLDEALEMANNSIYGLSSAIYTTDIRAAKRYIDGIEAGLAHVNVHTGYKEPSMPFGGVKQSGAGLPENSESGLEAFVDRKAVYLRGRRTSAAAAGREATAPSEQLVLPPLPTADCRLPRSPPRDSSAASPRQALFPTARRPASPRRC